MSNSKALTALAFQVIEANRLSLDKPEPTSSEVQARIRRTLALVLTDISVMSARLEAHVDLVSHLLDQCGAIQPAPTLPTKFFSPRDVAKRIGVTQDAVTKWIRSGKLAAVATPGGHFRILPEDVDKLLTAKGGCK